MRPLYLKLGDESNFHEYQSAFDALFSSGLTDVLGNKVIFNKDRCHHICYKPEDKRWNKGPRQVWRQERAERIPWIKEALLSPKYIRISTGQSWAYMLEVKEDQQNNLLPELFVAIVDAAKVTAEKPGEVYFLTAYTVSIQEWEEWKKNRPWIYPKEQKPLKPKRKKSKA